MSVKNIPGYIKIECNRKKKIDSTECIISLKTTVSVSYSTTENPTNI